MHFFGVLVILLQIIVVLALTQVWLSHRWDLAGSKNIAFWFLAPWLPFILLIAFYARYSYLPFQIYKFYFIVIAGLAFIITMINIYRSLWASLKKANNFSFKRRDGFLLLWITFVIAIAISAIIMIFAFAYALVTYVSGYDGPNYIGVVSLGNSRILFYDLSAFFYFSFVTYFSLGYGDCLPRGWLMLFLVYLESMLGYINAGILIAYAFNVFLRLNRKLR